ncbi:MAG: hypothetical protein ABEJ69_02240 [Candidatus Nanohaloarchaea archaeon]
MSLLGGGDDSKTCYVCGKEVDSDKCIEEDGKTFCCEECKQHYEDVEKPDEKEEICQFC